jgi:hypothetical protein
MAERAAVEPAEGVHMTMDEDVVRIVDALFLDMAERSNIGFSAEDVIDGLWVLFECGFIRLVGDDGHMGIEACGRNRTERLAQAKKNRPLVKLKRQMNRALKIAS